MKERGEWREDGGAGGGGGGDGGRGGIKTRRGRGGWRGDSEITRLALRAKAIWNYVYFPPRHKTVSRYTGNGYKYRYRYDQVYTLRKAVQSNTLSQRAAPKTYFFLVSKTCQMPAEFNMGINTILFHPALVRPLLNTLLPIFYLPRDRRMKPASPPPLS